jgi:TolB protein
MTKLKSTSTSGIWRSIRPLEAKCFIRSLLRILSGTKGVGFPFRWLGILFIISLLFPGHSFGRIFIDINAPSVRKFKIAIPDFKNLSTKDQYPELASKLPGIVSEDLDFSGYFSPIDKEAFLEEKDSSLTLENIRFKDWSVIGAELLLKGSYTCIGSSLEVEIRLFDVFWGRQILGKRALGDMNNSRSLMHRLGNDIIRALTGRSGVFLSKLAFVGNTSGNKEIYVCDYDGYNVRQITADKSIALLPSWSPNGKKIIYCSYREGGGPMLYMKDIASGAVMKGKVLGQLTNHWSIDVSPEFSPDEKNIVFVSSRSGNPQIYVQELMSGRAARLTFEGKYNTSPSWSILNRIAFTSLSEGSFDIYTMEGDGSRLRRLTENQGNNEDPCWSPDGRYIVFTSNREGRYQLYIMDAHGQNQRRITFLNGDQTAPSWGP